MSHVRLTIKEGIAEARLERGKVNALNEQLVDELSQCFHDLAAFSAVRGTLLTGSGEFFSFGFDIPEFKLLLRRPILEEIQRSEAASIRDFVEIWYSAETRRELEKIEIRS